MTALLVLQSVVLVVLVVLVGGLLQGYAAVLRRLHELEPGGAPAFRTAEDVQAPALRRIEGRDEWGPGHDVVGTTPAGEVVGVRVVEVDHDTVLVFLSSGCTGCEGFWAELGRPGPAVLPAGARLIVVAKDAGDESTGRLVELQPPGVDLVLSSQAWEQYAVPGSPYVVVVHGATGRVVGEGSGSSLSQVLDLASRPAADRARPAKPAADARREAAVDQVLLDAGIGPGHPSLHGGRPDGAQQ